MIAAYIWHWWIGVLLVLACIALVVAFIGGYVKSVTAKQYPGRRHRRDE
jgi:CDP-diglyceride synthetase